MVAHLRLIALLAIMVGLFASGSAMWCCGDGMFCGPNLPPGWPTATPAPPPTPTPVRPRLWESLPGFTGIFEDCAPSCSSGDSDTPDHHDAGVGEHAVDIGAGECGQSCPVVRYYDSENSTTANIVWSEFACPGYRAGGEVVQLSLTSLDPPGEFIGNAVYRHLLDAPRVGSVSDGTALGQVNPLADPERRADCWTGPHVHQGVNSVETTLIHRTGIGQNCQSNDASSSTSPCYEISW